MNDNNQNDLNSIFNNMQPENQPMENPSVQNTVNTQEQVQPVEQQIPVQPQAVEQQPQVPQQIGTMPTLDNNQISIASNVDKQNGITANLYYTVGSNEIELDMDVLPTQRLFIQYDAMIPGRVTVLNTNEIDRISNQLNNTGIISSPNFFANSSTASPAPRGKKQPYRSPNSSMQRKKW